VSFVTNTNWYAIVAVMAILAVIKAANYFQL
jgi:hypothetical protein